ncbi:MAG: hypothetical protein JJ863_02085 [Deltaproteobacteria bacterium]|nr:hypothetical protein [Deltaproteobacteria bacterium]
MCQATRGEVWKGVLVPPMSSGRPTRTRSRRAPGDPDDRNGDTDGDGYTDLEKYLDGTLPG